MAAAPSVKMPSHARGWCSISTVRERTGRAAHAQALSSIALRCAGNLQRRFSGRERVQSPYALRTDLHPRQDLCDPFKRERQRDDNCLSKKRAPAMGFIEQTGESKRAGKLSRSSRAGALRTRGRSTRRLIAHRNEVACSRSAGGNLPVMIHVEPNPITAN